MMKYCHYHYEAASHPKFYDKACELLKKAYKCAFTSQNEVDIFVTMVKKALDENKPEGHSSSLFHLRKERGGQIFIQSGYFEKVIACLSYVEISRFLEYDLEAQDFFDVSERYEEGGAL